MKKALLTIATVLLLVSITKANHDDSQLNLRFYDYRLIVVELDNEIFENPTSEFSLNYIESGRHYIKVWEFNEHFQYGCSSQPMRLLFRGNIDIPRNSIVNALVTRNRNLKVVSILPIPTFCEPAPICYNNSPYYAPINCLSRNELEALKYTINNRPFDSGKLQIAKQAVSKNRMNSYQVAELMQLLTFESNKLELAKFAYQFVIDPKNYYVIYNEFTFDSSVNELSAFIGRRS
jgi:hypothetical protein